MNHWNIPAYLVQVDLSVEFVEFTWMRGDFSVCLPRWHKVEMLGLGYKYEERQASLYHREFLFILVSMKTQILVRYFITMG